MFGFRKRRRRRLRATPLPDASWKILERNMPLVKSLSKRDRDELGGIVQVLLYEKDFEGCGGLEITDESRVTIAGQAALLLMHRKTGYYPTLKTILVYPRAYVAPALHPGPDGTISTEPQARLGESWQRGSVILSWDDVLRGGRDPDDGKNVTVHEFAHQLDGEWGGMEGAPTLVSRAQYRDWARVLGKEYKRLVRQVHNGHRSLLDGYGATNPAEFFSVATELFFERPAAMKRQYPELYRELQQFYKQDPAA